MGSIVIEVSSLCIFLAERFDVSLQQLKWMSPLIEMCQSSFSFIKRNNLGLLLIPIMLFCKNNVSNDELNLISK